MQAHVGLFFVISFVRTGSVVLQLAKTFMARLSAFKIALYVTSNPEQYSGMHRYTVRRTRFE